MNSTETPRLVDPHPFAASDLIESDGHRCVEGPLCAPWYSGGDCEHWSCADIIHMPCDECQRETYAAMADNREFCPQHGWQEVTSAGEYTGFAGGRCSWVQMACGCAEQDESADVRAAR